MDEALALPSAKAVTIALRTQQVIAHESGVAHTIDPLAGSFFVEALTNETEAATLHYLKRIEALGGVIPALEGGFMQREIAEAAYRYQQEIDSHRRTIVGVNEFANKETPAIPILEMDPQGYERQLQRLHAVRSGRDNQATQHALRRLAAAARAPTVNLMEPIIEAVNAYATLGEMCDVLREVLGIYHEPVFF